MNCKQATLLLSEAQERDLTSREKLGLRLHVLLCTACRRFKKQLHLFQYLLSHASPKLIAAVYASDATLSSSRREKIKTMLRLESSR